MSWRCKVAENKEQTVTQEDRDQAKKGYPNQTFSDKDLEMMKALGHL
jgi:hypothetical protein